MKKMLFLLALAFYMVSNAQINTDTARASVAKNSNKPRLTKPIKDLKVGDVIILTQAKMKYQTPGIWNYPQKIYTTKAAMFKDLSLPHKTWATNLEDKGLYSLDNSYPKGDPHNKWYRREQVKYYIDGILPEALIDTVKAISKDRRTLTLTKKSFIAESNAVVYVENSAAVMAYIAASIETSRLLGEPIATVDFRKYNRIPIGRRIEMGNVRNAIILGPGKFKPLFFSPAGAPCVGMLFTRAQNLTFKNVCFLGNHNATDYGFTQEGGWALPQVGDIEGQFGPGLLIYTPQGDTGNALVDSCSFQNMFYAVIFSGVNIQLRNSDVIEDQQHTYIGWPILFDGCDTTSGAYRVKYRANKFGRGWEVAKGDAFFKECESTNGTVAANSGPLNIDGFKMTITANSYNQFVRDLPLMDLNQRFEPNAGRTGGSIKDVDISSFDTLNFYNAVILAPGSKNVHVNGLTYIKPDAYNTDAAPAVFKGDAEGLRLERVKSTGRISRGYDLPRYNATDSTLEYEGHLNPDHSTVGITGAGPVYLKDIDVEYISHDRGVILIKENVKAIISPRIK